jgi:hypothetical protein
VLERAALPRRAAQGGDAVGDEVVRGEQAVPDEHADERRGERLRHRHEQVRVVGAHPVDVVLEHDPPVVDHAAAVGPRAMQRLGQRDRLALEGDRHVLEADVRGLELVHGAVTARDARGPGELADVQEAPAVERGLDPVLRGDVPLRGRGRPLLQPELDGGARFRHPTSTWRSPIRTGIARRFGGGASGQLHRGSYEQDGL